MEFENIIKLIETVSASNIKTFYLEESEWKIKLELGQTGESALEHKYIPKDTSETKKETMIEVAVFSPLVGIFYSSPGPDKPAFVKVGDHVKKGQILGIIESMKLMNEIISDVDGKVIKICTEDGKMVEYGQDLFLIEQ